MKPVAQRLRVHDLDELEIYGRPEKLLEWQELGTILNDCARKFDSVKPPIRRQNIWQNSRRRVAECGPRLAFEVKRRAWPSTGRSRDWLNGE